MRLLAIAAALLLVSLPAAGADSGVTRAQQQFEAGRFSEAINTLLDAARTTPDDAAVYFWLGRCYFELRNYRDATAQNEHAVKLAPNNSQFLLWLARAYGRQAENHHSFWLAIRSRNALEEAIQADPNNIPARRDLAEFYSEAPWIVGGNKRKAREQIAAIAAIDPLQGGLAQAEYDRKNGDPGGAETELRRVLEAKPVRVDEYYEVADYFASRGNAAMVQQAVDGASAVTPSDPRLAYYRGVILAIEGQRLPDAESYLKAYLAATADRSDFPPHANARTWLGQVYEKMGNRLEAAEQYRAALAIDPGSEFAKQSLKHLERQ
ncbi:MAG TPA: tetratricopeptide repeat protein [Candidatus Acidoferrales bacterium]|nr:tetratricopeptide repeat protein [Candidatus Acidoferrales bacterium]